MKSPLSQHNDFTIKQIEAGSTLTKRLLKVADNGAATSNYSDG